MLDASAGGALVDKTQVAAKTLIANRAHNAQQYEGVGQREWPRQHSVNEVVIGLKAQENQVCTVCSIQGHLSDKCPQLIENEGWESANAIGFQGQNETKYDPYSNTYNPGWRDHPNMKWREPQQPTQQGEFRQNPPRFIQSKNDENEKDILKTFQKVQVNIPLVEAIKQVPKNAKFLKELCTTKRRMSNKEVVKVSENVSAVLQRKLPTKCKDPSSFTIPCVIGTNRFEHAMLDLGASINVMPYSIYASMNLGELKNDGVIMQLADRSNAYPKGVLEDVLVQVNQLIFLADFYILDMEDSAHSTSLLIILGRLFMKITRTNIDVFKGTLTMEFDGEVIDFNISETMRYPVDDHSCFSIDIIDSLAQEFLNDLSEDALEKTLTQGIGLKNEGLAFRHPHDNNKEHLAVPIQEELVEMVAALESIPEHIGKSPNLISIPVSTNKLLPSVIQPPSLELTPLPSHLKYVFLYNQIMIASDDQEKTTFTCPFGTFAYRRMPFDLCNVPATFQSCMKDVPFKFDEECESVFKQLKEKLTSAPIIVPPDWSLPFELICDASDYALGAVLGQRKDKQPHVIYYASRTLNDAQLNYSTTEKELLAVFFALDKFRSYLIGTEVIVYSNHAALKYLLTKKEANLGLFVGFFFFKNLTSKSETRKETRMWWLTN
ncbi:uncharacterized protein [Malus domestica]|uniref:uncharacterized protein n=1 Tax=Malus domestica TaxID=3750 RepID=UPI003976F4CB